MVNKANDASVHFSSDKSSINSVFSNPRTLFLAQELHSITESKYLPSFDFEMAYVAY
jgi:hypothetical protein